MKANAWAGLVTNASPYAIPPSAAVEQVNLTTATPGQLTVRGGMRPVSFASACPEIRDCYPYVTSTSRSLIALNASGEVLLLGTPAYGSAPSAPTMPSLSPSAGQVQSNYAGWFYDYDGEAPS